MIKGLRRLLVEAEKLSSEILGIISAAPKFLPGKEIEEQGYALLVIRKAKEIFDTTKKDINKVLDVISEQLCQAMVNAELTDIDITWDDTTFRLYPDARGFYSIPNFLSPDFAAFYAFVQGDQALKQDAASRSAKRALDALCDQLLEQGKPLPPQVNSFIKATVKVRRLRHG